MSEKEKYTNLIGRDDSCLLLIDFQKELLAAVPEAQQAKIRNHVGLLAKCAQEVRLPLFLFRYSSGEHSEEFIEELREVSESAHVFTRNQPDIWAEQNFTAALKQTGRKTVILAALMTDLFLVAPAIRSVALGYRTYAVGDASATWSQEALLLGVMRMLQAGVTPVSVGAVLAELHFASSDMIEPGTEKMFGVYAAMFGMTGNISAATHATRSR